MRQSTGTSILSSFQIFASNMFFKALLATCGVADCILLLTQVLISGELSGLNMLSTNLPTVSLKPSSLNAAVNDSIFLGSVVNGLRAPSTAISAFVFFG